MLSSLLNNEDYELYHLIVSVKLRYKSLIKDLSLAIGLLIGALIMNFH